MNNVTGARAYETIGGGGLAGPARLASTSVEEHAS